MPLAHHNSGANNELQHWQRLIRGLHDRKELCGQLALGEGGGQLAFGPGDGAVGVAAKVGVRSADEVEAT